VTLPGVARFIEVVELISAGVICRPRKALHCCVRSRDVL
jgi:hypothetical protein